MTNQYTPWSEVEAPVMCNRCGNLVSETGKDMHDGVHAIMDAYPAEAFRPAEVLVASVQVALGDFTPQATAEVREELRNATDAWMETEGAPPRLDHYEVWNEVRQTTLLLVQSRRAQ